MEPWFQHRLEEMMSTYVSRIDGMLNSRLEALKQDVRSNIADLRRECRRVPSRDNTERGKGIMAATATPAVSHLLPNPKHTPTAASSASSSTTASTWSTASSPSWSATSLRAPTATDNSTPTTTSAPSGSSGITSCVASSMGAIGVPPSTALSDADQVLDAPATCSTLGLYPVASAIQVNKAPLPVTDEFLMAPTSVECPPAVIHSFLGPAHDSDFVHAGAPEVLEFGTQSPSTATHDAVSELVAPMGSNKVHGDEAIDFTTLAPTTCSAKCFATNIWAPSPAFSTTRATPSILLPAAASALCPELVVQVQVPPSTLPIVSVHEDTLDTEDTNDMVGMSLTTSALTESRASQSLQWFVDRVLHMLLPTKCLSIGTYSLLLLLPPVALNTIDTTMTERQYVYEDSRNFIEKVTEIAATLVCFPPLPWDEKQIWPLPFSLNVLAFNLQVDDQQNRCTLLDMSRSPLFEQCNISKDIIHVHAAVDGDALVVTRNFSDHPTLEFPRRLGFMSPGVLMHIILGGFELLHWKMAWSFHWGCSKNASLVLQHFESVELKIQWLLVLQILVNGSFLQLSSSRSAPCFLMENFSEWGSQQKCEWKAMPYCTSVAIDQVLVVWPPPVQMSIHDSLSVKFLLSRMNAETGSYDCALLAVGQAPNLLQFELLPLMRSISCLCCWNSGVPMVYLFGSECFQWKVAWALDWGCSASGNEHSFELQQWRIVWFVSHAFLQSGLQFCSLGNDSIIDPDNSSFDLTCTRCVCVQVSHNGSPANHQSNLFLAEETAAVHIINYQFLLLLKTYGFGVRLARGRAKFLGGVMIVTTKLTIAKTALRVTTVI